MHLQEIPGRITSGLWRGKPNELINFQLWEIVFGKAAFVLPEQRPKNSVCLRYMNIKITDTVSNPGYV